MGDTGLRADDVVPFVDPAQAGRAEVDRPDAVVDLLEADGVLLERVGDEEQALLEAEGAGVGDALDDEVAGILDRRAGLPGTRAGRAGRATPASGPARTSWGRSSL